MCRGQFRGATTAEKLRATKVWVPTLGACATRSAEAWAGCWVREGIAPPAVRVRGYQPRKIFENSYAKSCILVTCWGISCFLPRCMKCRRGLAMRILSVCLSVCLSVRPSVTRVIHDKMEERSVQIFIPYERTIILVFWEQEWLVGGDPFYVKFWVNRPPLERNRRFSTNSRS